MCGADYGNQFDELQKVAEREIAALTAELRQAKGEFNLYAVALGRTANAFCRMVICVSATLLQFVFRTRCSVFGPLFKQIYSYA